MPLKIQIITFLFSFLFGILFGIELKLNYKFIYQDNKIYKIITNFFFVLVNVLIYFIILRKINDGILHPYEILAIVFGFIVECLIEKYIIDIIVNTLKR